MLRPSPLAISADNHLLVRSISSFNISARLPPLTSDHFNLAFKRHAKHRFLLPSLSFSSSRVSFPSTSCTRSYRRSGEVENVKEVTDEGEVEKAEKAEKGEEEVVGGSNIEGNLRFMTVGVGNPSLAGRIGLLRMSLGDRAFFLMAFVAATTSIAFASLVAVTIHTLLALKRTAKSLARLADTASVELPSTMAAIRLSGLEISDLTVELSDLRQEIAGSVSKSTQAVKAAGAGIKQIGVVAHQKTMSIIEERANLPEIPIQPFVAGAVRKASRVVGQAGNNLMGFLSSNAELSSEQKPSANPIKGKSNIPPNKGRPKPSTVIEQ